MNKVTIAEEKTLYSEMEQIKINSPVSGLVVSTHEGITIIPHVVKAGDSMVIAVRLGAMIKIKEGDTVGIVLPIGDEDESEADEEKPKITTLVTGDGAGTGTTDPNDPNVQKTTVVTPQV